MGENQHSFQSHGQPPPPPFWQAGNYYQVGNIVWWAGSVWKCEKPHTSGPFNREVRFPAVPKLMAADNSAEPVDADRLVADGCAGAAAVFVLRDGAGDLVCAA